MTGITLTARAELDAHIRAAARTALRERGTAPPAWLIRDREQRLVLITAYPDTQSPLGEVGEMMVATRVRELCGHEIIIADRSKLSPGDQSALDQLPQMD